MSVSVQCASVSTSTINCGFNPLAGFHLRWSNNVLIHCSVLCLALFKVSSQT